MENRWKKNFILLWSGQFISLLTSSIVNFAIIAWLSLKTGSAEVLTYAAISGLLVQGILGPFAGVFVDRWNKKLTMILSDGFVALATIFLASYFYCGGNNLNVIYMILALRSLGSTFHMPAMQSTIPLIAPKSELLRIAGANQIIRSASNIVGPAVGVLLITILPIGNVLLLDVLGAFIAVSFLFFITIPNEKNTADKTIKVSVFFNDMKMAYQEVLKNRGLFLIVLYGSIVGICIVTLSTLIPLMTISNFHGGKIELGIIESVWASGSVFGGGLLLVWKPKLPKVKIITIAHLLIGMSFFFSGLLNANYFYLFVLLTVLSGVSGSFYNSGFTATIQTRVNPKMLGRVFAMYSSIDVFPTILTLIGTGFIADHVGINIIFVLFGLIIFLIGVLSFVSPSIKKLI
ncbi:MFS transporter [Chryseobacterium gleum]|uniref:MFS transporter n=1 Tax=Chryseobacterium gleum TaxID=250 RepID=UPI0028A9A6AA|nr:MFS transporter [Chryseobacterium gleum]